MRINKDHWLFTVPIAHRGLWGGDIVENSITAYENAAKHGFPIEIDLYCTADGHLVSFHDKTLERMTGKSGYVFDKTLDQLKGYSLNGTKERIPTFDEVLAVAENRVPLLIEIKNQPRKDVVEKIVERLKTYNGEFAVQSFNPLYLIKLKKLAPEFIRGVLGTKTHGKKENAFTRFLIKNMPLNSMIKPDFISYSFEDLPLKKRKAKNTPLITWTVTSEQIKEQVKPYCKNIIFEHFTPEK